MKTYLEETTVGADTLKVGSLVNYGKQVGEVTAIYNYEDERCETYGPVVDLKFLGGTIVSTTPGLDPSYKGLCH